MASPPPGGLASVRSIKLARQLSQREREARLRAEAEARAADEDTKRTTAELAAVLEETQQRRVAALRQKQAQEERDAARKRQLGERIEAELTRELGSLDLESVLRHFGVTSMKKLLVRFHPDRTPPGAGFEEAVRREVIFKWVQQKHDQARGGGAAAAAAAQQPRGWQPRGSRHPPADSAEARAQARRWREEAEAKRKAEAAEAEAKARAAGAVLRVLPPDGVLGPDQDAAYGYYERLPGEHKGKPMFRRLVPSRGDFPWAKQMEDEAKAQADHIYWSGNVWHLGGMAPDGSWYLAPKFMGFGQEKPPTEGWEPAAASRPGAPSPLLEWLE